MFRKIIKLISASVLLMTHSGCSKKQQPLVDHGNQCVSSSGLLSCGKGKLITRPFFYIELDSGLINIDFTWKGVNANIGCPLNRSKLECRRLDGFCTEIAAMNIVNDDGSIQGPLLFIHIWDILSWSNSEIILKTPDPLCATAIMTIDLKNQKITNVRTAINSSLPVCQPPLGPLLFITESVSE